MAKQHLVKCKYCGIIFDTNQEAWVEVSSRRYAHKSCVDKQEQSMTQDEKDYFELEKYIKKLFNTTTLSAKIKKQIKDFRQEYNYTYTGIQKTLIWWYEIQGHSIEESYGGIGIVPYVYNDASTYYYSLWLANNANADIINYKPQIKEIEIGSPRTKKNNIKLFKIGDDNYD